MEFLFTLLIFRALMSQVSFSFSPISAYVGLCRLPCGFDGGLGTILQDDVIL